MPHSPRAAAIEHEQRLGLFVIVVLFLSCSDVVRFVTPAGFPVGPISYLFTAAMLGFALVHVRFVLRAAFGAPEITLLLALVVSSTLWSIEPDLTLKRSIQILSLSAFAMALAAMLSMRSLVLLLAASIGFAIAASLVAVVVLPEARGSEQWPSAWRGVFNHKNGLGANSVFGLILLSVAIAMTRGWARGVFAAMFAATLVMLLSSESRTSQLVAIFCVSSLLVALAGRGHARVWMVLFLGLFLVGAVVATLSLTTGLADPLFEALGRRPTLSNRIPLWKAIWPDVMHGLWTGYGYEAFWNPESSRVLRIERIPLLGFSPHYSHNGVVETLLNAGILGVALVAAAIVRALLGASAAMRVHAMRPAAAGGVTLIVAFIMFNVTESLILNVNTYGWTAFLAVLTKLGLLLGRKSLRWQPRSGRLRRGAGGRRFHATPAEG